MKKNRVSGLLIVILLAALALFPLHATAQEDAPQAVVDSRSGVFRVVTEYDDGTGTGSGFAVGTEDEYYIVTNHHVVADDPVGVYVLYDTGRHVEAEIITSSPLRDIAILKPLGRIPDVRILPLETQTIDSGMSVYALGYPYAADLLAGQIDFSSFEDILKNLAADKQSMTVTNGIVSAIIDSSLVGIYNFEDAADMEDHTTKLVQTNTALNHGNSGGPLLNREGHVVGVNTLGLGTDFDAMNGSVHVDELIRELRNANIEFEVPYEDITRASAQGADAGGLLGYIGWIVAAAVLLLALGVGLGGHLRKNSKKVSKNGVTLAGFERKGQSLDPVTVTQWSIGFIKELRDTAGAGDPNSLLDPENIEINQKISLIDSRNKSASASSIQLFPGYSAPENYRNRASGRAAVYFVGAMMSTLLTGHRPEDALTREENKQPLFATPGTLGGIVNAATQPEEQNRIPDLGVLLNELEYKSQAIQYESSYQVQPGPGAGYR